MTIPYPWDDIPKLIGEGYREAISPWCHKQGLHYLCQSKRCTCPHHTNSLEPTFRVSMDAVREFAAKVVNRPVSGGEAVDIFYEIIKQRWTDHSQAPFWAPARGWFVFVSRYP